MEIKKLNYLGRLPFFLLLRLSMNRWLSSKLVRPKLLRLAGIKMGEDIHIGANMVIAAGCVVTYDIPDNCLVGGICKGNKKL